MYTDDANMNNRVYRESEQHVKLMKDGTNIRMDAGFDKQVYEEMHDPE